MNRAVIADRALYMAAAAMLTVHGLYHLWADLMGIAGPKNPLAWLFGNGQIGLMMHVAEWPLIFSALAVAFLNTNGHDRKAETEETDTPDGMHGGMGMWSYGK